MKILFAASECAPFVKVGGLGDVVGALPKALHALGVDVVVVLPFYMDVGSPSSFLKREGFSVRFNDSEEPVKVYESTLPGSEVPIFFLKNDHFLSNGGIYFSKTAFASCDDEIRRFAFFSKAVSVFCEGFRPDVVHCHDWHTGLVPYFLKDSHLPTVLTIHNLANQGLITASKTKSLGVSAVNDRVLDWDEADSNLDLILQGIVRADVVTTVSKTYAHEITTKEFGEGLQDVLLARGEDVIGIVNGLDDKIYDSRTDPSIKAHYDSDLFVEGKLKNKIALQKELGLAEDPKKMLVGLVSRLTYQKGIDLVLSSLNEIIKENAQLVILGTGETSLEEKLVDENKRLGLSGNYKAILGFDEGLARRIYASADLFLVPSRFEPCGLTQLIAMRYGTLPVVRGVGGLKDTVKNGETGFVFTDFSPKALGEAVKTAHKTFLNPYSWQKMVTTAMSQDFSWRASAERYVEVYRQATRKHGQREELRTSDSRWGPRVAVAVAPLPEDDRLKGGIFRFDKKKELWTIIAPSRKSRPVSVEPPSPTVIPAKAGTQKSDRIVPGSQIAASGMTGREGLDPFAEGNESLTPPEVFRIGAGAPNEPGWRVRVTPNKFPITDWHEVIIHNPDSKKDWSDLSLEENLDVLRAYKSRLEFYSAERADFYPHLYCNHGAAAGASLPHPHSQLVVFNRLPDTVTEEVTQAQTHYDENGRCVYCALLENELVFNERVVWEDKYLMILAPFASAWPYELTILPKRHSCDFVSIDSAEMTSLATALKLVTGVVKAKFNDPGYNFWIHSVPQYGDYRKHKNSYHWHLEFVPRLKVLAGIELGAGIMVDDKATPEAAAKFYRENL